MTPYNADPTIGLLELSSIARGLEVADRVLKEAVVRILVSRPVSPGKYLILFTGSVEDVQSSLRRGAELGEESLVDRLFLPSVHDGVFVALDRPVSVAALDAVGVIETYTVASTLEAADRAAKKASVTLLEIHLAQGIGGKSYVTLTGEVSDVESAVQVGSEVAREKDLLVNAVVIPRAHDDLRDVLEGHQNPI